MPIGNSLSPMVALWFVDKPPCTRSIGTMCKRHKFKNRILTKARNTYNLTSGCLKISSITCHFRMSGSNIYPQGWPLNKAKPQHNTDTSIAVFLQLNIEDNTIARRKKVECIRNAWIVTAVTECIQVESTFRSNADGDEAWKIISTGMVCANYEEITLAPTTQII